MFNNAKRFALGLSLLLLAGAASATTPAIDTSAIVTSISDGQAAAIVVALAFGVAVWAVKGVKMIRRA